MATADSVKAKLQALIDFFNEASGGNETTLSGAIFRFLFSAEKTDPVLSTLSVTENGTYTPPDGVTGYNQVEVNVSAPMEDLYATENGEYTPSPGFDGYSTVRVEVDTSFAYQNGYGDGYAEGQASVDTSGEYNQGYTDGQGSVDTQSYYDDGYNTGYSEGYEAGRNSVETT